MQENNWYAQQGDVILRRINKIPEGATRKKTNVLAEGESTGHAHRVEDAEVYEANGVLYLRVKEEAKVTHEEHKQIDLPAGDYEIGIVQEYDHFKEEARSVAD